MPIYSVAILVLPFYGISLKNRETFVGKHTKFKLTFGSVNKLEPSCDKGFPNTAVKRLLIG